MNEERSKSDYSEFISQSAALARRRLLDEYGGSGLQREFVLMYKVSTGNERKRPCSAYTDRYVIPNILLGGQLSKSNF
jgi:vacuolar-type H+-ATPase subunit C/Vma6